MPLLNLYFGWLAIIFAILSGMLIGIYFHNENWLGGYSSFRRRMLRLGHISFFGIGTLNILYSFTVMSLKIEQEQNHYTGSLFLIALATMPTVCFLTAYKKHFRHLFFIPVLSLLAACLLLILKLKLS